MSCPDDKSADLFRRAVPLLAAQLRDGTISSRGLLDHFLARIAHVNPSLNAFTFVDPAASAQAEISDTLHRAGHPRGMLEGIPVGVKDSLWVRGLPAVWGSPLFAGHVAAHDERTIARLRESGAVIIGKTNCPEFAMRGITDNPVSGATANPWDMSCTPGGSSGGAVAAVAAGLVPLALATDGGGSIRRPAAHTGLVGFKPSNGRVRRGGGFPQLMFDCEVIGPIARDVAGTRLLFDAVAAQPSVRKPVGRLRILFVAGVGDAPVAPEIIANCSRAAGQLSTLGHNVVPGTLPFAIDDAIAAWSALGAAGLARLAAREARFFELAAPDFIEQARAGQVMSAADHGALIERLLDFRVVVAGAFDGVDVIMTPATAAQPWPLTESYPRQIAGQAAGPRGHAVFTGWVNAAGHPAITVPVEPDSAGMPIGCQLVGAHGADDLLLDLAELFETAHPWADRWPSAALRS